MTRTTISTARSDIGGSVTTRTPFFGAFRIAEWHRWFVLVVFLFPCSLSASLHLGTIHGVIRGPEGEAISQAKVRIEGPTVRASVADSSGRFSFFFLPAGLYVITAEAEKYGTVSRTDVVVEAGRRTMVAIDLPADPDEVVTLTEESSLSDPADLDPASTIDRAELRDATFAEEVERLATKFPAAVSGPFGTLSGDETVTTVRGARVIPRVLLNGIDISSDPLHFTEGILRESLHEVSLIASSSDPAFGTARGELHLITPAAPESFGGSFYTTFSPQGFQSSAGRRFGLRRNEIESRSDLALEAGGEIIAARLRAWGFVGTSTRAMWLRNENGSGRRRVETRTTSAFGRLDALLSPSNHLTGFVMLGQARRSSDDLDRRETQPRTLDAVGGIDLITTITARVVAFLKVGSVDHGGESELDDRGRARQESGEIVFDASTGSLAQTIRLHAGREHSSASTTPGTRDVVSISVSDYLQWERWSLLAGARVERSDGPDDRRTSTLIPRITISRMFGSGPATVAKLAFNQYHDAGHGRTNELVVATERSVLPELIVGAQFVRRNFRESRCGASAAELQYDAFGLFTRKRMSNRWMLRSFVDAADQSGGCGSGDSFHNDSDLVYGVTAVIEGPWSTDLALSVQGRNAVEVQKSEASPAVFQMDLRFTRTFSIAERTLEAFAEMTNATNEEDDLGSLWAGIRSFWGVATNNQLPRSVSVGARLYF